MRIILGINYTPEGCGGRVAGRCGASSCSTSCLVTAGWSLSPAPLWRKAGGVARTCWSEVREVQRSHIFFCPLFQHLLSERLRLSASGEPNWGPPWNPMYITALMYGGFHGGPQLGPPDAERRQSLGQQMLNATVGINGLKIKSLTARKKPAHSLEWAAKYWD